MRDLLVALRRNQTRATTVAVFILLFLVASLGMPTTADWAVTTLRGFATGAVIFLVAAGFSIILGLMGVLNLAQGALFMIGAYVGWTVYVRADTFVDLLTPVALLGAGFLLKPLWERPLARLSPRLPSTFRRTWPWIGLVAALVLFVLAFRWAPVATWDADIYADTPIIWSQAFEDGETLALAEVARFQGIPPAIGLAVQILAGLLLGLSLTGVSKRHQTSGPAAEDRQLPWGAMIVSLALIAIGLVVYATNDALTEALFGLDTTWLFLIALVVATLTGFGLGALMEATLIRPLYERHTYQIMLTFGLGYIGVEIVRAVWGRDQFTIPNPSLFANSGAPCPATTLGGWFSNGCSSMVVPIAGKPATIRTYNEIFIILIGLVVLVSVWILLQRTRLGMIIRAGVQDSEMVEALGINVRRVFTLVFGLGVAIAALGGVLHGTSGGLSEKMSVSFLLGALIALAIGGLTSYPGAALGAVLVGLVQQFIIKYGELGIRFPWQAQGEAFKPTPPFVAALPVVLMVIILIVMPQGLLGRKE